MLAQSIPETTYLHVTISDLPGYANCLKKPGTLIYEPLKAELTEPMAIEFLKGPLYHYT
jgi:hypothetical protein